MIRCFIGSHTRNGVGTGRENTMSDQASTTQPETVVSTENPTSPENSAGKPTPKNEKVPRNSTVPKAGVVEKVRSAAARVLSEAGFEFHKGRGRPKNCPDCQNRLPEKSACETCNGTGRVPGKLDGSITGVPALVPAGGLPENSPMAAPVIPASGNSTVSEIFRRSCVKSVKGFLGILKAVLETYMNAAGCRPAFTEKTLAKAEPDAEALNDFTESLDAVMKKRNIAPENAEEWALGFNTVRLLAPYGLILAECRGEFQRNRQNSNETREQEKAELRRQILEEIRSQQKT